MKFVLWNIGGGFPLIERQKEWSRDNYEDENIQPFIDVLEKEQADSISLQEVHAENSNASFQLQQLGKQLGMSATPLYSYGKSHIKPDSHLSMAILSKLTILTTNFHLLPNPNLQIARPDGSIWKTLDNGLLLAACNYDGQIIHVVDGHLAPFHYFQRDFSEKAFDHIRTSITNFLVPLAKKPTIIAADFNFDTLEKLLPGIFPTFSEIFNEDTTPTRGQQDHMLVSMHWNVLDYSVQRSISDHFLCTAKLELKK